MAKTFAQIIQDRIAAATAGAKALQQKAQATTASIPTVPRGDDGGSSGGSGPTPFAQTQQGLIFSAEQDRQLLGIQRTNQEALVKQQQANALILQQQEQAFQTQELDRRLVAEAKVRAEERERLRQSNIAQLRTERIGAFSQLIQSGDQVRAVLFALGYGPENDAFDVRARSLGTSIQEIKGARELRGTTQAALSKVLGRGVTISQEGVRGLGTAISSARAFAQGGADVQTLLSSAFGVGSLAEGEQPGISAARLQELVKSVTPTGTL